MILTCPNCGTQYVVKDGAIPPQGRQVRCAACKNSWHQDPEAHSEPDSGTEDEEQTVAEATLIDPRTGPEAEERAYEETIVSDEPSTASEPVGEEWREEPVEAAPLSEETPAPEAASAPQTAPGFDQPAAVAAEPQADWREPPQEVQDDDFGPFPEREDAVEPRRRSPLVGLLLIIAMVAAVAAAFWFLAPPEWKARVGLTGDGASPLALVTTHMDRQRLESGNELLTVTGRVINPTDKDQPVPPLQAELRSSAGQLVYSWTIAPPARTLPPGASASFNSAEVNVPPGGDELTITLGSPRA